MFGQMSPRDMIDAEIAAHGDVPTKTGEVSETARKAGKGVLVLLGFGAAAIFLATAVNYPGLKSGA